MDLKKIGKFIAELRKSKNLTQEKLGSILGVTDNVISKWERGITAPDLSLLNKLSEVLEISISELLNGQRDDKNTPDSLITGITYYTKETRNKYVKLFSVIIIVIIALFAVLFTINNYNRFKVYRIKSKHEKYYVDGYMIFNQEKNLTIIKTIDIHDKNIGTSEEEKVNSIKVSIISGTKNIFSIFYEKLEKEETINSFLIDKTYFVNEDIKSEEYILSNDVDLKKMSLKIEYTDDKKHEHQIIIPLDVIQEYSNNKLFY